MGPRTTDPSVSVFALQSEVILGLPFYGDIFIIINVLFAGLITIIKLLIKPSHWTFFSSYFLVHNIIIPICTAAHTQQEILGFIVTVQITEILSQL